MNLHEYQARAVLKAAGVPVPDGDVASTPGEAESLSRRIGGTVVVKAQVHAGGRGKAGGVKVVRSPGEAKQAASEILGMTLHTPQTPPEGKLVRKGFEQLPVFFAKGPFAALVDDLHHAHGSVG